MTAIRSEARKLFSVNYWWFLGLAPIPLILVSFFIIAIVVDDDTPSLFGHRQLNLIGTISELALFASVGIFLLCTALFGAITGATETTTGTASTTFATRTRRSGVIAAKTLVTVLVGIVNLAIVFFIAAVTYLVVVRSQFRREWFVEFLGALLPLFAAFLVLVVLWLLIGLGLGMLIGNTIGAVSALLFWYPIGELIVIGIHHLIVGSESAVWLPLYSTVDFLIRVESSVFEISDHSSLGGASILFLATWATSLFTAGWLRLARREIR